MGGREQWINDHLPESKQDAAWRANTKEEDAYKAKLKAAKRQLANAQKAAVDGYVLADATGGAQAAAANSASMKNTVARLELQINNQEEEVNDLEEAVNNNDSPQLEAALKSKRQELESSRAQLRAAKAKLATAKGAEATGTLQTAFLASKQPIDAAATYNYLCGTVALVLLASMFTAYQRRTVKIDPRPLLS